MAMRFGLDTAFIVEPKDLSLDVGIRYFVPRREMGISGHATIAALTIARNLGLISKRTVRVETITGVFKAEFQLRTGDTPLIRLEQFAPSFGDQVDYDKVVDALGISIDQLDFASPIQPVSVSRSKLMVPLDSSRTLDRISPKFDVMWKLCESLGVTGFYPFTRHPLEERGDIDARQFPYEAGLLEDPATGVAASALAAYLVFHDLKCVDGEHAFQIGQGYAMGSPSRMDATAICSGGRITGTAIIGACEILGKTTLNMTSLNSEGRLM